MRKRILVYLDALLDTRIGAMNRFSSSLSCRMVEDEQYYQRIIDDFERYGTGTTLLWRNVYNQRDVDILTRSRPTMMMPWLAEQIRAVYASRLDNPVFKGVDLTINLYPYQLPAVDAEEIALAMQEQLTPVEGDEYAFDTVFKTTCLDHQTLSVHALREDWDMVVMYDFHDWYDVNARSMYESERGATFTQLVVPALVRELPDRKQLMTHDGGRINPFHETQRWLATSLRLSYFDASWFSLPNPKELKLPGA